MSDLERTFIDLCLDGDADVDEIYRFIDLWHENDSELSIFNFLGMTEDDYGLFLEKPSSLKFIVASKKYKRPVWELIKEMAAHPVAARSGSDVNAKELLAWLKKTRRI